MPSENGQSKYKVGDIAAQVTSTRLKLHMKHTQCTGYKLTWFSSINISANDTNILFFTCCDNHKQKRTLYINQHISTERENR